MVNKIHEFLTGLGLFESTTELTGCCDTVLLLDAAHLHTHMFGFDNNHNAERVECFLDTLTNLHRHAFLNLQAVAVDINHAGNL